MNSTRKFTIKEIERYLSWEENPLKQRLEEIVGIYSKFGNKRISYTVDDFSLNDENGKKWLLIDIEKHYSDGDTGYSRLSIPADLVNKIDEDICKWFETRAKQIIILSKINDINKSIDDEKEMSNTLQRGIDNLQDARWLQGRITELNDRLQDTVDQLEKDHSKARKLEKEVLPEFRKGLDDENHGKMRNIYNQSSKRGWNLVPEWRDICSSSSRRDDDENR
jgi:hypothetical protein